MPKTPIAAVRPRASASRIERTTTPARKGTAERKGKVGRPPRINRELIAEAAHDIGLADLTLKAVADHLGVSIAGLYHHIDGKDDLMRLAAEYSATRVELPEDRGQHWALWLLEWARYNRDAFMAEPGLLVQYLEGAISAEAIADNADTILGLLVRQGFSVREALSAYQLVSSCALGAAVNAIREQAAAREGRPQLAEYHRVLAQRGPDELTHLRVLVAELATNPPAPPPEPFRSEIITVLAGIAVKRGDDWKKVSKLLDQAELT
jgi:AcrR family transcriptional regulator